MQNLLTLLFVDVNAGCVRRNGDEEFTNSFRSKIMCFVQVRDRKCHFNYLRLCATSHIRLQDRKL